MSFWTAIVVIVAIGSFSEVYRARIKKSAGKSEETLNALSERIGRIEERMANMETIVLDLEKARKFDNL